MKVYTFGDQKADTFLVQMADDHDLEGMEQELAFIRELTGGKRFCMKAVKVGDWTQDLSPWPAPAVFGNQDFGDGAANTLAYLLKEVLPERRKIYLGGYSLAGLFALWAGYQTDRFAGIAAASPSVWYPGFVSYIREQVQQPTLAHSVYLSLGDREEKTRNPVMAQVGTAIRQIHELLSDAGADCILEWNQGTHFRDPDLRTAKAFSWLMNRQP